MSDNEELLTDAESYEVISENRESTVVGRYERRERAEEDYQSEAQLEGRLIRQLAEQGYEYVGDLKDEAALTANLRREIERLNGCRLSDGEWQRLFRGEIARDNGDILQKTETIQKDYIKTLRMDDGSDKNIYLIDKRDIHHNTTQVINQYSVDTGSRKNRYDVTLLVNGLPLVHIELKRLGVALREAFNQIDRYGRESFWAGNGLFDYVQLFIISNGTQTKYYSNTTRRSHVDGLTHRKRHTTTSNSFEFTSYWADAANNIIGDIEDFTATFLSRHTLLNVLTKYCVFTEQCTLMVMRPYQIAATERIINRIEAAHNQKLYGTTKAGGYVWHTTGSGKTLTSFKTAQLATLLPYIDKVFFVVDRKDLDYQTMKEYDRFEKGAANGNTSTRELVRQINDASKKIIITTIQKLSCFVGKERGKGNAIYQKEVVFIFDECHRSQFGDMHKAITRAFKRYYLFGFTGTPIFGDNITASSASLLKTTEDAFGTRLHTYTIVDAIRDHNVLPFRIDYVSTIKEKADIETSQVWDIRRDEALCDKRRIRNIVKYIIDHFDQQTKRGEQYQFNRLTNIGEVVADKRKQADERREKTWLNGFNSILATQSTGMARLYYEEFKRQTAAFTPDRRLKVAVIFTYAANEDIDTLTPDENPDSAEGLDQSSRDFLDSAINDYNTMYNTDYDTSAEKFPNYYKDISQRMKNREIDLLIVVNMFLTGFDATTLNTLWVDKNLRYHGLLQAFSRTNRILNSVKTAGNIVCFRNLDEATNKALSLFGDEDAHSVAVLRRFEDYMNGYEDSRRGHVRGYKEMVAELTATVRAGDMPQGEDAERTFIRLFGNILRMRNLLECFDQFAANDPLTERDRQDYTSVYIDLRDKYRDRERHDAEVINDDVAFEMELVKQIEAGIDYILFLVRKYHKSHCRDKEIKASIMKTVDASPSLRDKRELIERFVDSLTPESDVEEEWTTYINARKREELDGIIAAENLRADKTRVFMANAFRQGYVAEGGMELDALMPPLDPFDPNARRGEKIEHSVERLKAFFNKYYAVANGTF